MEILGLVGSPRRGGNTDILMDVVLDGAQANNHKVKKLYLRDFDIGPCIDCRGCKKGERTCVLDDGMNELYERLDSADVIVFGTPVYWCAPSGPMKLLVDRLRPYVANGRLKGKKGIVIAPAKDGPGDADLLTEMFRRTFGFLGMEAVGQVLGTAYDPRDILGDEQAMERAAAIGKAL